MQMRILRTYKAAENQPHVAQVSVAAGALVAVLTTVIQCPGYPDAPKTCVYRTMRTLAIYAG